MSQLQPIMVGDTFGLLKVVTTTDTTSEVACECGQVRSFPNWKLQNGLQSCGCNRGKPTRLTAFGETKNLMSWNRDNRCTVKYVTLVQRLSRGWTPEDAITQPVVPKTESNLYKKGKRVARVSTEEKRRAREAAGINPDRTERPRPKLLKQG